MHQLIRVDIVVFLLVISLKQALSFISYRNNNHHYYYIQMNDPSSSKCVSMKELSFSDETHEHSRIRHDCVEVAFTNFVQQIINNTLNEEDLRTTVDSLIQFNSNIQNKLLTISDQNIINNTHPLQSNKTLHDIVLQTTDHLRQLMNYYGPSRGQGRKTLVELVKVSNLNSFSNVHSIILIVSALALNPKSKYEKQLDHSIAVSRAIVSAILPPKGRKDDVDNIINHQSTGAMSDYPSWTSKFASNAVYSLCNMILDENNIYQDIDIDLHIITSFARTFVHDANPLSCICASVIRHKLNLRQCIDGVYDITHLQEYKNKSDIIGTLGLAGQLAPWSEISPIPLVEVAITNNLWHAAECLCDSVILSKSPDSQEVVQTLIDGAVERHLYRMMDSYATTYYDYGGNARFAEARFMHACNTIAKVVVKRQYPIIEKQVERVDAAYNKVKTENVIFDLDRNGPKEVREFALEKLMELNEHDVAHRLAMLWGFDFMYNEQDAEKYAKARQDKYLQYSHAFPNSNEDAPELISCPILLSKALVDLKATIQSSSPVIGFDVEWGEEKGASLLQLSTMTKAILVDIPALVETKQGCDALDLVGQLFQDKDSMILVGFSCSEDISRLKASVGVRATNPWLTSTSAVIDLNPLIAIDNPALKHIGLSKLCNLYLGKPLDKSEQCSLWDRRPLTKLQRIYAVLDAWAVVAIWNRIRSDITDPLLPKRTLNR